MYMEEDLYRLCNLNALELPAKLSISKHASLRGPRLLCLDAQPTVVALLLLHPEFPLLSDFHVVVLEPEEVLSVAPVRG